MDTEARNLLDSLGAGTDIVTAPPTGNIHTAGPSTSIEERALSLLGSGVSTEQAATALGVSASRISQLLSEEKFAMQVATLRYEALQKHNVRDSAYDTLEDRLLEKLQNSLSLMMKPETILKAIQVVNGAKRRGQSSPDQVVNQQNIVNIVLPTAVTEKFVTNVHNQVVSAGDQNLLTMPSNQLLNQVEAEQEKVIEHQDGQESADTL